MLGAELIGSADERRSRAATPARGRPRRVLMITYEFPPNPSMASQTCAQIARSLPLYGWEPVVLTARGAHREDYDVSRDGLVPRVVIRTGVLPHPCTVYKRLKLRSRPGRAGGADRQVASSRSTDSLRRWVLSMLLVPDVYTGWIPTAIIAGLRAIRRYEVEHLLSASPHSTGHLVGWALARLTGLPWTAQFQDPWTYPQALWQETKPVSPMSARVETALERMVLRRAGAVVCVTEQHTEWLRLTHPDVHAGKFVTILNGFDGVEWERVDAELRTIGPVRRDKFVITYAGTLYHRRSPLPVFQALRSLIDSGDIRRERVQIDLLGQCDLVEDPGAMAAACGLEGCVRISGLLGRSETLRRVAQSDLLLLLAESLTQQIPGKTYEYLRAGRPILALTSEGAVADLLRRTGGAWVVDAADQKRITAAVLEAYRLWSDGLPAPKPDPNIVAGFDRRVLSGQFAATFERPATHVR